MEDMPNCDDCGQVFATIHDLQRHVKLWCPERTSPKRKREDDDDDDSDDDKVVNTKWINYEGDDEEEIENDALAHHAYGRLLAMVKRINAGKWERKTDEYVDVRGMTEKDAQENVKTKFLMWIRRRSSKNMAFLLKYMTNLQHGTLHKKIVYKVIQYKNEGFDLDKSVRRALKKYEHDVEAFVVDDGESEEESEDDSELD
jgi:hypothetical protein